MNNLLLIDLNWTYNRFFYVKSQQNPQEPQQATNQAVLEFLSRIQSTKQFNRIFVIVDGAHPRTKEIYSEYKAGRSDKSQVYAGLEDFCKQASKLSQVTVLQNDQAEADELIAYICYKHHTHARITIYSGDKDLLQLSVYPSVSFSSQYKKGKFLLITREEILQKFSNSTKSKHLQDVNQILIYRVFRGDSSDNIPAPVKRMQFDQILAFLGLLGTSRLTHENFTKAINQLNLTDKKLADKIQENQQEIFRNYRLMSLLDFEGKTYITEGVKRWH